MTKTVKQIAADCGVSEQAIRAWCRRNHVAKDAKHGFVIDETTLSAIYQHYRVDKRKQVSQRAKPLAKPISDVPPTLPSRGRCMRI